MLEKNGGYTLVQSNEFKVPNEWFKYESPLKKFFWGQKKIPWYEAADTTKSSTKKSWIQKNMEGLSYTKYSPYTTIILMKYVNNQTLKTIWLWKLYNTMDFKWMWEFLG